MTNHPTLRASIFHAADAEMLCKLSAAICGSVGVGFLTSNLALGTINATLALDEDVDATTVIDLIPNAP